MQRVGGLCLVNIIFTGCEVVVGVIVPSWISRINRVFVDSIQDRDYWGFKRLS